MLARGRAGRGDDIGEVPFPPAARAAWIVLAREGLGAVLLFLGAQDIGGAAIAREQVLAVFCVEELSERLDPADDHEKIVLTRQREHRVDEVVPRALLAQVDFQAIGEEGEEVGKTRNLVRIAQAHQVSVLLRVL